MGPGLLAAVLALGLAAPARAEVKLLGVVWQLAPRTRPPAAPRYADIDALKVEGGRLAGRLRARLTLTNPGAKAEEGILLRYSLTARVAPEGGSVEAVWAVPFLVESRRVPNLAAAQTKEVPLDPTVLVDLYLRRLARSGYAARELKLLVMVEPQRGKNGGIFVLESSLPLSRAP